jgi:RNA polymerase sigma-32 factor
MSETKALTLRANQLPAPTTGSLEAYIQAVSGIPVLDVDEEQRLARALRDESDLQAAQTLVLSNLRFVVHVARGYSGYGLPLADLIQEGNIGLMKAVKRFDPDVGVRLISFAVHWIRAEIHEFILRNWRIVKIATTKAQRKLFFNLRSAKKRLGWMNDAEVKAVADDLGVKPETVLQMERRLSGADTPYNALPLPGDDEDAYAPEDYLAADESFNPAAGVESEDWETYQHANLDRAIAELDERSRDILESRWLREDGKIGLAELGEKYGVSAERICQLENAAIKKLRGAMVPA